MEKKITATESVRIDKELATINSIVLNHDTYFYKENQLQELHDMQDEINAVFDEIFRRNEK
jgi:hypothetical protein